MKNQSFNSQLLVQSLGGVPVLRRDQGQFQKGVKTMIWQSRDKHFQAHFLGCLRSLRSLKIEIVPCHLSTRHLSQETPAGLKVILAICHRSIGQPRVRTPIKTNRSTQPRVRTPIKTNRSTQPKVRTPIKTNRSTQPRVKTNRSTVGYPRGPQRRVNTNSYDRII